jgi:Chain length determinant protein
MVNDPDDTTALPIVEARAASNGMPPRGPVPRSDTFARRQGVSTTNAVAANAAPYLSQPTVFGAVSRYRILVLIVALLGMVAGVAYAVKPPKEYRAQAFITMPQQVSLQGQQANAGQYLDSQVLLLQSQDVAQRAATIANAALNSNILTASDFFGPDSHLLVSPPTTAAPGAYGATVIGVTFAGTAPQIAQDGANAVLQAYDQARTAAIKTENNSVINALGTAIGATNFQLSHLGATNTQYSLSLQQQLQAQRQALTTQRAQAIANEQIDLAQQPSAQTASKPVTPSNHKWSIDGAAGLIGGILLGAALAFALASRKTAQAGRRRHAAADREDSSPFPPSDPWRTTASSQPQRR